MAEPSVSSPPVHGTHYESSSSAAASPESSASASVDNKRIAQKPWGSVLKDQLSMVNPFTWIGLAKLRDIDLSAIQSSLVGILLPLLAYQVFFVLSSSRNKLLLSTSDIGIISSPTTISSDALKLRSTMVSLLPTTIDKKFLIPYFLSPWVLTFAYRCWRPIHQLVTAMKLVRFGFRSQALPEAWEVLALRIRSGRAYRTGRYDIYLPPPPPPPPSSSSSSVQHVNAILFLPGAGVQDVAYARPAALLSDAGFVVVVVTAEPLRMASPLLGYTASYCQCIQRKVEMELAQQQHALVVRQWFGVGHSLGSFTLTTIAQDLGLKKLLFWGSAPFVKNMSDISKTYSENSVLVIQGSEDAVVKMVVQTAPDATAEYWKKMPGPQHKLERVIPGGTHAGFASYQSASPMFSEETSAGIPRQEQHERVVQMTVDFLNQK